MKDVGFAQQTRWSYHNHLSFSKCVYNCKPNISTAMTTGVGRARCDAHNFVKNPKPRKPIIQKRSILALFRLPYIGQYVRFSAMELKWSFLRGPAHKIEKRPFFVKKTKSGGAAERVWSCDLLCNHHLFPHSCVRSPASFEAQSVIFRCTESLLAKNKLNRFFFARKRSK